MPSQSARTANRRVFLNQMGSGLLLTTLGLELSTELGLAATGPKETSPGKLEFGKHARLVDLLTETPLKDLQGKLVEEIDKGTTLAQLTAAGALANAQAFGGEDYVGYHAFMALMPAFQISKEIEGRQAALPVMKVLYRNSARLHEAGRHKDPVLTQAPKLGEHSTPSVEQLLARVHDKDKTGAEAVQHQLWKQRPESAIEDLIPVVCQEVDVHRVVLAWRAWDLSRLAGQEHGLTLLRQSVRQCVEREGRGKIAIRQELPQVLESTRLFEAPMGRRSVEDEWIESLAKQLTQASRKDGAGLVAEALKAGVAPEAIGEALSLASTHLMLRQEASTRSATGRRRGSVHGAGVGVHSSDTAAAWRAMARFGSVNQRQLALVAGGYHVAGQKDRVASEWFDFWGKRFDSLEGQPLLSMLKHALNASDQENAAAAARCYVRRKHPLADILTVLRDASVRAEGALHAEKYYRTQVEAIEGDRPAFRELHMAALARVCASQSYADSPGHGEAVERLS